MKTLPDREEIFDALDLLLRGFIKDGSTPQQVVDLLNEMAGVK